MTFNGGNNVDQVGTTCAASNCSELIMLITLPTSNANSKAICMAFNDVYGIVNPSGAAPTDTDINTAGVFNGVYASSPSGISDFSFAPEVRGRWEGCVEELPAGGGSGYNIYYVLHAR